MISEILLAVDFALLISEKSGDLTGADFVIGEGIAFLTGAATGEVGFAVAGKETVPPPVFAGAEVFGPGSATFLETSGLLAFTTSGAVPIPIFCNPPAIDLPILSVTLSTAEILFNYFPT